MEEDRSIFILPEYCWGDVDQNDITVSIDTLRSELRENQYVLFGSFAKKHGNTFYNTAIFASKEDIMAEIQKTRVLSDEAEKQGVLAGNNSGVVKIEGINVAIIICADIWDHKLLGNLIQQQSADILLVPAFTVVPPGYDNYAKTQWHSLAIVRSREYLIPIAIADHSATGSDYGVGKATCIVDPSIKSRTMRDKTDFLALPENNISSLAIDLDDIRKYKQYRIDKGLYSEKVI